MTSSANATLREVPRPVRCNGDPAGTTNCSAPGGIGPGPLIANEAHSTCTANEAGLSGTATFVNGILETKYDSSSQVAILTENVPANPPPNYTRDGTLDHVGDSFRVVFNEQILGPDSITVNAAHMYLLGPTAVGDMVIGQSRCGVDIAGTNAPPTATDDAYSATAGRALSVAAPGLLANDADPEGQPLRAATLAPTPPPASGGGAWTFPSDPAHGTLALGANGSFTYTPDAGYTGPDTFPYLVQDARGKPDQGTVTITVGPAPPGLAPVADFDGDGDSDISVYRPSQGVWYVQGGTTTAFGTTGDVAVPADYDGDGDADVAVFRPANGVWFVSGGATVAWGTNGDIPVPADYDGDGQADLAVFRPAQGVWYVSTSGPGPDLTVAWGTNGDIPVPADYDGDGDADIAVFRPSQGVWFVQGGTTVAFGTTGDVPVPADYDGDGDADIAVFRPSEGVWYVSGGATTAWGTNGDRPVPADYDGDGDAEIAVFRPSVGVWFVQGGTTVAFGTSGDRPLPLPAAIHQSMAGGG